MTTLREAAAKALEAMEKATRFMSDKDYRKLNKTIEVLRAALAEPVQEPFWVCPDSAEHRYQKSGHCEDCGKTLVQETT